jgi:mannose-1-phosphate guanylyltransferase
MRYALIIAGGSGTRLWPMSRGDLPKQLIPFLDGKSLLRVAFDRFEGMLPVENRYICAGEKHRSAIVAGVPGLRADRLLGEPVGRDTLNAVALGAAVLAQRDPEAVIGVFTADHLIEPVDEFQRTIDQGFNLVEQSPQTLVTFGIAPTGPATGYGYLELDSAIEGGAFAVRRFKEKPALPLAEEYFRQGADHYLWNSGMFVWRASTLLDCVRRYEPSVFDGLSEVARAWHTPDRDEVLAEVYPTLKKISVDFAVMEPASTDPAVRVAAIPMRLQWLDIGSWPSFAATCPKDGSGNAVGAGHHILLHTNNCLVASDDPSHLIATIGCSDLIVIHTGNATLVCRADQAEQIKQLQQMVVSQLGDRYA